MEERAPRWPISALYTSDVHSSDLSGFASINLVGFRFRVGRVAICTRPSGSLRLPTHPSDPFQFACVCMCKRGAIFLPPLPRRWTQDVFTVSPSHTHTRCRYSIFQCSFSPPRNCPLGAAATAASLISPCHQTVGISRAFTSSVVTCSSLTKSGNTGLPVVISHGTRVTVWSGHLKYARPAFVEYFQVFLFYFLGKIDNIDVS